MSEQVTLRPVDAADVTILIDNAIDILVPSTEVAQRPPLAWDWSERDPLRAEHGYALALTVEIDGRRESILYDAGLGRDSVAHNLDVLGLKPAEFRALVLSHGHADHHGGLEGLFRQIGRRAMPLVLHPDAWRDRKVIFPTGAEIHLPPPSRQDLDREGWEIVEERAPTLLLEGAVLVTGQIERVTDFEQGFPIQYARTHDGGWELDRWIWDDQAVVVHVRERGLVVLSSCSHSGAINLLRHAQGLTGVDRVYAFVGGMHLTGGLFEPIIGRTLEEMAAIGPAVIVPGHCSGWRAIHALAARLPNAYIQSNVGTRLHFAAPATIPS
jgi:7,8-dihydropterin-6-yl-methyl-4-(beta-D-ribofuranosyl)aminobenzene 5'-phosphate synthase